MLLSRFVEKGKYVEFDLEWSKSTCPILYIRADELAYWKRHRNHRPVWYSRVIIDSKRNRFCNQFIAHWPDQYDWKPSPHKWDYEPIFLYYKFRREGEWNSIKEHEELIFVAYDFGHYVIGKFDPRKRFSHVPFRICKEGKHLLFIVHSGYHAYEPLLDPRNKEWLMRFEPEVRLLSDEIIARWRERDSFIIDKQLFNPWITIRAEKFDDTKLPTES